MSNMDFHAELKERLDNAMAREKERLRQAKHRRNVAALVDFTSNLLSLVGRRYGVQYMPVTNSQAQYGNAYNKALQRYNESLNDYKGVVAGNLLRERLATNRYLAPPVQSGQAVGGFGKNTPPLIDKARVAKVFNNSRTIKNKDYVFSKSR